MSLGSGILVLIAIWCTIHILSYISTYRSSSILPTGINYQPRNSRRHTRFSLHSLHLKISTTAWNTYHDTLSSFLVRRGKNKINTLFKLTYDLGAVFGAVGIVVAVATLLWICTSSAWTLLQKMSLARNNDGTSDLMKRETSSKSSLHASSPYLEITPIVSLASFFQYPINVIIPQIPGVTVPLAHFPIIFLAVFLSQIFHEFGHVLAAARYSKPFCNLC
jgi:S2P endopeptidase